MDTSDPYVMLTLGRRVMRTPRRDRTLNPQWNMTFKFAPLEELGSRLELRVMDWDRFSDVSRQQRSPART